MSASAAGPRSHLIVHSAEPLNAEPPLDRLRARFLTDSDDFYVRSHGDTPRLDASTHRLRIDGLVARPLDLSLDDLRRRFPERRVTAVLQCAGNRRADLQPVRATTGDPWSAGAIGHAEWTGVPLADLLREAGSADDASLHVAFASADTVTMETEGRFNYGVSIPIATARSPDVLCAWAMNGRPLAPEHGHPLRVVVPGFAGVRSAKWLTAITVQATPSDNHMQRRDYRMLPSDILTEEAIDWSRGTTIDAMPLNAAICEPATGATVPAGPVAVRGWAVASQRDIARVDVSADGGRSWMQATLEQHEGASCWSWRFWTATVPLAPGEHELAVRAWDDAGQTQPARADEVWNVKGYLSAAIHRVPVRAT